MTMNVHFSVRLIGKHHNACEFDEHSDALAATKESVIAMSVIFNLESQKSH